MFGDSFRGRRILVTGHTGFKGAWLTHWLLELGADVVGIALPPQTPLNLFDLLGLAQRCQHIVQDIRDFAGLEAVLAHQRVDAVVHLAAQSLVRESYREPRATFETNVLGTINLLECLRRQPKLPACLVVTSDKCYENRDWTYPYRESDTLGGHDPYSASKAAAEIAVASYRRSFFQPAGAALATARAGNVIGGGDWAAERLLTDLVQSVARGEAVQLRNPGATRPWQHVLEPLSGYLVLLSRLLGPDGPGVARAWNFGPDEREAWSVEELARRFIAFWGNGQVAISTDDTQPYEAQRLTLNCSQARAVLHWQPVWRTERAVHETVHWYRDYYTKGSDVSALTSQQIASYCADAAALALPWCRAPEGTAAGFSRVDPS